MNKLLFVINPASGGQDKDELIEYIKSTFENATIHLTTGENDPEKINQLLDDTGYERVIVGGGDGTIAMVAKEILFQDLTMGIIPLGSANGLARELSIPNQPKIAISQAINKVGKPFDVISINDKWTVLHMADFGMNATLVRRYQNDEHRGFLGYAISGLKELPNLMALNSFDLTIDGKHQKMESTFVIIANARRYGTGIEVNPQGKIDDGKFEICCLQKISFESYLKNIIKEEEFEFNPFKIYSSNEAHFQLSKITDFQVDGEYIGEIDSLNISIKKGALKLAY